MSEQVKKVSDFIEGNKQLILVGAFAVFYVYATNRPGYHFFVNGMEAWAKKHNPINTIFPMGKDTSNTNKFPIDFSN